MKATSSHPKRPASQPHPPITCVAQVTREYGPKAGAGGVKDVAHGLAKAAAEAGIDSHVYLPFYPSLGGIDPSELALECSFDVPMHYRVGDTRSEFVTVYRIQAADRLTLHLVQAHRFSFLAEGPTTIPRRGIYTYTREEAEALGRPWDRGKAHFDYFAVNVLLAKATLHAISEAGLKPQVIQSHDGHTALLPVLARASTENYAPSLREAAYLITLHNANSGFHQEIADLAFAAAICGLDPRVVQGGILNGRFDPLFLGCLFADGANTVSENYAREIQHTGEDWRTEWLGHALLAAGVELFGVTDAIDVSSCDPRNPALPIPAPFSPTESDWGGKEVCKRVFLGELASRQPFPGIRQHGTMTYEPNMPLLTSVGRFSLEKGLDVLGEALETGFAEQPGLQCIVLGTGDPGLEARYVELAERWPGRMVYLQGFSPALAERVYAAGDFLAVCSRSEPCCLTDLFAQMKGNLPVVHAVGGLVKTIDGQVGFTYLGGTPELLVALRRALTLYREDRPRLRRMQTQAARNVYCHFTWQKVLEEKYLPIYREILRRRQPALPY